MNSVSGIGVLDKTLAVLGSLEREGPLDLAGLVRATGFPRATAHRLALALEVHGLVGRDSHGRFTLGLRLLQLGAAVAVGIDLRRAARPVMEELSQETGESVQLFVRDGDTRVCIEGVESERTLRDFIPVGARLPISAGSGGKVLRAWPGEEGDGLGQVRRRGWADSVAEREAGVASVSAPVRNRGAVVAALSLAGPIERLSRRPGHRYAPAVIDAADRIGQLLPR
jgi:DNA-binding IclR family transcriptional regulator